MNEGAEGEEAAFELGAVGGGSQFCPHLLWGSPGVLVVHLHCHEITALSLCNHIGNLNF